MLGDTKSVTRFNRILFVPGHWNMASPVTIERLKGAERLWWDGGYDYIIVSGGITRRRQCVSEADFMKDWLVKHANIPPGCIITECASRDSFENVRNTTEWYLSGSMYLAKDVLVTIVSQWVHAMRLHAIFEAYGVQASFVPVPGHTLFQKLIGWCNLLYTLLDPKGENELSKWKVKLIARTLERA